MVYSNDGSQELHMVEHFGNVDMWYNVDSLANNLSLTQLMDQFRVMMDLEKEHAFLVWIGDNSVVWFQQSKLGFFYFDTTDNN